MKPEKNILIAFALNLAFSVFEFVGGIFTGSIAIVSDAVHDMGDAASIGISCFLEKKSRNPPDETHTYGYARYSVIGSAVTTIVLLSGSVLVIFNAIRRMLEPAEIHYNGMILFAVIGVCVNFSAAWITHGGTSFNQKAVNLHMIEDVLGWVVVLIGAIVMKWTGFTLIDPIMSIGVAGFILVNAVRNLCEVIDLFLEKTPCGVDVNELKEHLSRIDGVTDVHHIHIWSLDGQRNYATMHIAASSDPHQIKDRVRRELREYGIEHVTLELETEGEPCREICCPAAIVENASGQHHHHHHHH